MGISTYYLLSNRHKAIVKTIFFQKTGILESDWTMDASEKEYHMTSPTFWIDGIYKSMEGPKASRYIQLNTTKKLLWIKGFKISAKEAVNSKPLSNDFIYHMNVDINDAAYYDSFGLQDRIGKQYPRLTSLSHGLEQFQFPEGYGIPIYGNQLLYITTQSLNHNYPKISKKVKHQVDILYEENKQLKPLLTKTVFIQLPFDSKNPFKEPLDPASNQCIPVETKNHTYCDKSGNMLSGHWIIPKGSKTYHSSITAQLQIKDSLRLHFGAPHVHPFATSISLLDKTTQKTLFTCKMQNYASKIGLRNIETFSSSKGVWLYANHEYELAISCHNTSDTKQDMMGSIFLFFYDAALEKNIKSTNPNTQ